MTTAANYDSHRVYHLSESLRKQIKASRLESERTVQTFFADAINEQLPGIVEALQETGMQKTTRQGPMKVGMTTATLKLLHSASARVGVSQVQLVQACLLLATRGTKPKTTRKATRKRAAKK